MKYDIDLLKSVINRVCGAIENNAEIETFREMKLSFYQNTATLSGFMPGFSVEEAFGAEGVPLPTISLGGQRLKAIIDHLPGKTCDISFDGERVTIKAGRSRYVLPVARDRDYLEFRWPQGLEMQKTTRELFTGVLRRCLGGASKKDEDHPERTVVHFDDDFIVSADGAVMACEQNMGKILVGGHFNMSSRVAEKVLKTSENSREENLYYAFVDNLLYLMIGRLAMVVTGAQIPFPAYGVVLNNHRPVVSFPLNRKSLMEELSRLSVVSETRSKEITMVVTRKGLTMYGNFDGSEVETFVDCDIVLEGELKIGFFLDVLIKGVKTLSEDIIQVEIQSQSRPICFREKDYGCFIMPRRF